MPAQSNPNQHPIKYTRASVHTLQGPRATGRGRRVMLRAQRGASVKRESKGAERQVEYRRSGAAETEEGYREGQETQRGRGTGTERRCLHTAPTNTNTVECWPTPIQNFLQQETAYNHQWALHNGPM